MFQFWYINTTGTNCSIDRNQVEKKCGWNTGTEECAIQKSWKIKLREDHTCTINDEPDHKEVRRDGIKEILI